MAMEQLERRIGGHVYRVTQMPTLKGAAILVRLVKLGGPGVGSFVNGLGRGAGTVDGALAFGVGEALHDLSSRLREDEFCALLTEFAQFTVVVVSNEIELRLSDVFDDHFAGEYGRMLKWVEFCLEVNFKSFFVGASGSAVLARLWAMVRSALTSPLTSPGTSTASPAASTTPQA